MRTETATAKFEIKHRWSGKILFATEAVDLRAAVVEAVKGSAYLRSADLGGADLQSAYLQGADLGDADLQGADLGDAKNYSESHDFFYELVRRHKLKVFTEVEWSFIGQIAIHRLCWESIKQRFGEKFLRILEVLKDAEFGEYYDRYKKILEGVGK